jgi:glucose-6-phosphate 1-dehydrogenase
MLNGYPSAAVFIIFGGAGDLTMRKLIPALHNLFLDQNLPEKFKIIAIDKGDFTDASLRKQLFAGVNQFSRRKKVKEKEWKLFADHINFYRADFTDHKTYTTLLKKLNDLNKDYQESAVRVFYLATPPSMFSTISTLLGEAGLNRDRERSRLVIEKPVGYDIQSAHALNQVLTKDFLESQIFRIDHYLGKETVQNILAFRFANPMFEPLWNRRYIDRVTITVAEDVGIDNRGAYYDKAGALRDMVQNHLIQLLCLIGMEPPVSFAADEIRNKKMDVLHAIRPIHHNEVHLHAARGQYDNGWINGNPVPAYRQEKGVSLDSATETYAALKFYVDNWRWQGVPFYLRTGKRLPKQVSEISIFFKAVPHRAFPTEATLDWQPARLILCIQPQEGIILKFKAKQPGPKLYLRPVDMRFSYREMFNLPSIDAYETLLWDLIRNDSTLFMRADQVEMAWQILTPVLDVWASTPPSDFPNYKAGTWGPESADTLLAHDGYTWMHPAILDKEEKEEPAQDAESRSKEYKLQAKG